MHTTTLRVVAKTPLSGYMALVLSLVSFVYDLARSGCGRLSYLISRLPKGFIASVVGCNFLKLAIPLLACLSDDSHSVEPDLLIVSLTLYNEQDQAGDILEFDDAQIDSSSAGFGIPIFVRQRNLLRRWCVICLVEAEVVRSVGVELDHFGSAG